MYLLEHDAKSLLAREGINVPAGCLVGSPKAVASTPLPTAPWVVKGQITAGGRGRAGIVRKAETIEELHEHAEAILGMTVKGRRVSEVRIEQDVGPAEEAYVALLLDAAAGGVRVIVSAQGGMDVEALLAEQIRAETADPDHGALCACLERLTQDLPERKGAALRAAGTELARVFLEREILLIEVNPLFVKSDGTWIAGDAKIVTDDGALPRQAAVRGMLDQRAAAYPEAALKLEHGCDYVVVDPEGELGLLTTGAGLSMMLIDELRAAGFRPYNFLDVRTGGLRGETARLVNVLKWISAGPRVQVLLVNIFAGITDLAEFSRLLVEALAQVPELKVPTVARLVGNGLPAARDVLAKAGIHLYTDLDEALVEVRRRLEG
jgi:succinyl-CoA synthetase beta subunit